MLVFSIHVGSEGNEFSRDCQMAIDYCMEQRSSTVAIQAIDLLSLSNGLSNS
jgi:hypothetical protein